MKTVTLSGRTAIVTGAGRGLGLSHARLLAARGARVIVNDVALAEEAARAISSEGLVAVANDDDISTPDGAASLVRQARDEFGRVDILVNNAGIGRFTGMSEVTVEEYEQVRRIGLDGTFFVTREVWPLMTAQRYGRVVVTSSGNGLLGNPASISYAMTKAGVFGLMRAAALDGGPFGIKVNSISPAASTPMADAYVTPEVSAKLREQYPTSLVSPMVAVLASEECPVTGRNFSVGGGRVGMIFQGSTPGFFDRELTPESLLEAWPIVVDRAEYVEYPSGNDSMKLIDIARTNAEHRRDGQVGD